MHIGQKSPDSQNKNRLVQPHPALQSVIAHRLFPVDRPPKRNEEMPILFWSRNEQTRSIGRRRGAGADVQACAGQNLHLRRESNGKCCGWTNKNGS